NLAIAIAQILTVPARRCFKHAPLCAGTATAAGSGKTLLHNIVSLIGTGSRAPVCLVPVKEEEFEKRLEAKLIDDPSARVILLDNIAQGRALQGAKLDQIVTEDLVDWVITDQNAASNWARFAAAPEGVSIVSRDMTFAERWTHPGSQIEEWRHK